MNTNRNFGHLDKNASLVYAAATATVDGVVYCNPSAAMYARCSPPELPIDASEPADPAPDGYHYEARGWEERDGTIRRVWEIVANPPPPPRRWTRLSIKTALATAGNLSQALAYLSSVEIAPGYSAASALQDCDYIEEGFGGAEKWGALLDGAAVALGKTRSEIDAFLDALPTE